MDGIRFFFFFSFGRIRLESINMRGTLCHARPEHNRDVNLPEERRFKEERRKEEVVPRKTWFP